MIIKNITAAVGGTPLALVRGVYAKLEFMNPAGSVKDRPVLGMLRALNLPPGATVVEATSGNTGVALAAFCAGMGHKCVIFMPDSMSVERQKMMRAYGAELILTPAAAGGMGAAVAAAQAYVAANENAFILGQFENPANWQAHFDTTGPEIWEQMGQDIDVFISATGTGGTLTGVGRYLRAKNPAVKLFAVAPVSMPHKIAGIAPGFTPKNLDTSLIDEIIKVSDDEAFACQRELAAKEGIFAGISSGAAMCAALSVAQRAEFKGKKIVTVLPDRGERYLSVL